MQSGMTLPSVLVFGGTGAVGSEILKVLAKRGVSAAFTFCQSHDKARILETEFGHRGFNVDLTKSDSVLSLFKALDEARICPSAMIYAAARHSASSFAETSQDEWRALEAVNVECAFVACQELAKRNDSAGLKNIVFLSALDRTQSIPLPPAFAATQGKLSALAMALSKELGPKGVCVNVLALGVLSDGISKQLPTKQLNDFKTYSALRRPGTAAEAATAAVWLALENTYMSGKVMSVNGGV